MAKKQTRRSISVSRSTYERLKAFCETSGISMSQCVETQVGSLLGEEGNSIAPVVSASTAGLAADRVAPRPTPVVAGRPQPAPMRAAPAPVRPPVAPAPRPAPMTSAAARYAVDPPPPIIKKAEQPAPKAPTMPKANEIFTF